jgi:hypothetical protein
LIKDIQRTPYEGIGKPEPLKFDLAGFWSRQIGLEHRLVYQVDDSDILIFACRFHYDKKEEHKPSPRQENLHPFTEAKNSPAPTRAATNQTTRLLVLMRHIFYIR